MTYAHSQNSILSVSDIVDPEETPRVAASDLDLYSMFIPVHPNPQGKYASGILQISIPSENMGTTADTYNLYNVISTLMQRHDWGSTSASRSRLKRLFNIVCYLLNLISSIILSMCSRYVLNISTRQVIYGKKRLAPVACIVR